MNKKLILPFLLILITLLTTSLISAELCRGNDGYYHDCDDSRYFEDYDDEYYYNGRYYPSRAYYYRDYYSSGLRKGRSPLHSSKIKTYYHDVEEYTRTTEYNYEDRYGYESIKTTILEKTEIESDYEMPIYRFSPYRDRYRDRYEDDEKEIRNYIPWHYSQYKRYY